MSLSKAGLVSPIQVTLQERDAITDKQPGYIVFNSDAQEAEMWTGTEWIILGNRPGVLNYRGGIDMTTSAPTYQPPENGDMYLNEKEGVVTAGWENLTGLGVLPNDRVVFDGTDWALITSGGGIPNLQVVTDAGDTTNHTITTAGYITAGNVQATDGYFSGNVGIGTTSPDYTLHVENSSGGQALVKSSGNTTSRLFFANTGSSANNRVSVGATNEDFRVDAGGTERFRVKSNGNVGIGTDSPTQGKLVVGGTATEGLPAINVDQYGANFTNTSDIQLSANSVLSSSNSINCNIVNGFFAVHTGGAANTGLSSTTELFRITKDGNVGIGTVSPINNLHVKGTTDQDSGIALHTTSSGDGDGPLISFSRGVNATIEGTIGNIRGGRQQSGGFLAFSTRAGDNSATNEQVRITNDGKVGIGTDSPSAKLEISRLGNAWTGAAPVGGTGLFLNNGNNADASPSYIQISSGKSSQAGIYFGDSDSSTIGRLLYGHQDNSLRFHTNDLERVRIDSAGRLLVGASSAPVEIESIRPQLVSSTQKSLNGDIAIYSYRDAGGSGRQTIAPRLFFARSRSGVNGSVGGIVSNNDDIGNIRFAADDGTQFLTAAEILVEVDGTPGANDMPGRLVFSTTAAGASTPTERMRISNNGNIGINTTAINNNDNLSVGAIVNNEAAQRYISVRGKTGSAASNVTGFACLGWSGHDAASPYTTNSVTAFSAQSYTPGTNQTLTDLYGFSVSPGLNLATNNYGFYSSIAAGSGRWNFYANGTAGNYFAGNVLFGNDNASNILNGSVNGKFVGASGILHSSRNTGTEITHVAFYNTTGGTTNVGSITTTGLTTAYSTSSDYRLKENVAPMTGATERVKALKPCRFNFKADTDKTIDGFLAHEAQEVVPESVTGTKDATEAIGTLFDWDGKVREENVTEPAELTYSEEVIDDPGQEGKEAVYSEPVLIQEYQPPVYGEPELISPATEPVIGPMGRVIEEGKEAVYGDPVLITPEVPEQWSEPELISPAVEEREPTYKTVTRQMSWTKTSDRDVMQGIDQSKLVPLLTAALQEALTRIEVLESKLA